MNEWKNEKKGVEEKGNLIFIESYPPPVYSEKSKLLFKSLQKF